MRRTCLVLMLVALFLGGGTGVAYAGHALNDPVATTNPGDFWVSGNMDCDGTSVWDGVATWNADGIFAMNVSVGRDLTVLDDLTVTDYVTCDHLDMDGTETDELIDVDRVIDADATKDAVTVTETRTGVISADGHAGFSYKNTIDGTYAAGHYGFYSEIDHDAGTLTASYPFFAKIDSEADCGFSALYAGQLAYDGAAFQSLSGVRAALSLTSSGDSASDIYAAYTIGLNKSTGTAFGYRGYGSGIGTGGDAGNAVGVEGFAASIEGLSTGVSGLTQNKDADSFAFVGEGHNHFSQGVTSLFISDAVATVTNKTHVAETDDGSLWVENKIEVDGAAYFDSTLDVDGQADFNDVSCDSLYVGSNLTVVGALEGARNLIVLDSASSNRTNDEWLYTGKITTGTTRGLGFIHDGSIIGISGRCNIDSYTPTATLDVTVYIDGVEECQARWTIDATGVKNWSTTFARGDHTFATDQFLSVFFDVTGTAQWDYPICSVETQLDD